MLFTPYVTPSITVSKPYLISWEKSVQASLSVDDGVLRCSLRTYGRDFRRARLTLVRSLHKETVEERLCEAGPGAEVQSEWRPVMITQEPILVAMRSYPLKGDVVALLRALGVKVRHLFLFGAWLKSSYVAWDCEAISYRLRLVLDWKVVDEAELVLRW